MEMLGAEIDVKIKTLFHEIQKAICFTYSVQANAKGKDLTLKSENSAMQKKLQEYLKHVYDCSREFTSLTQFMSKFYD